MKKEDFLSKIDLLNDELIKIRRHIHAHPELSGLENKTAIFFGFQNCSPIEDDINLVEKVHQLGCRFMQLTYNNQSLICNQGRPVF